MKYLSILLLATLCWASCQENPAPKSADTPAEIQAGAPKNEAEMKALASKSGVQMAESEMVGTVSGPKNGTISGSNVSFRKAATITSDKMGTFESNEAVTVNGSLNVEDEGEAILSKSVSVKGTGGTITLPKGKAVIIEHYLPDSKTYVVTYEDPKKGNLSAKIDANSVDKIALASWAQVTRKNGDKGWVLGKYLKIN